MFAIGKIEAAQAELKTARLELDADPDASLEVKAELDMAEGRLLAVAGQAKTGLELLKQGLSLRRRLLGAGDPALADTLTEVARAASYVGERGVVRSHYGEALQIYRKAFGGHHEAVAQVVNGLGILALGEGDLAEALKLLREALVIRLELLGPNHPSLASSRMNVAAVLRRQGEFAAALAEILNAEDIAAHAWPDGHVNRDLFALERGIILTELGRTEEAAALLWRLRSQFATSSVPQPRNLARTELALADVCQRLGDSAASTEWLSRAAPVIEARYPENDLNRQQLQSVRARMAQSAPGRRQPLCRGAGSP